jgi:hypothetical protein
VGAEEGRVTPEVEILPEKNGPENCGSRVWQENNLSKVKDLIKVTVKFIRRGIHFQQTKSGLSLERPTGFERERGRNISCSSHRKWE